MAERIKVALKKLESKVSGQPEKDMANNADYLEAIAEEYAGGGAGGAAKYAHLYFKGAYPSNITFQCDDISVSTYDDLVNYLKNKGFVTSNTTDKSIVLPAVGQYHLQGYSPAPVEGLTVIADSDTGEYDLYVLSGMNNNIIERGMPIFEITFLGGTEETAEENSESEEPVKPGKLPLGE